MMNRLSINLFRVGAVGAAMVCCFAAASGCHEAPRAVGRAFDRIAYADESFPQLHGSNLALDGPPVSGDAVSDLLPETTLTLEQARLIAVRANPDIHVAQARLEGASARIAEARSRFFPTVSFSHNSARTFHTPASRNRLNTALQPTQPVPTDDSSQSLAVTTLLNALRRPLLGLGKIKGDRNSFSEHSLAMTTTWTLFDGFSREAQLLSAKHLHRSAAESLVDVARLITHAVDTAYYQIQLAEERVRISEADAQFSQDQLEETRKLHEAGRATQADVDNFRVRNLAARADVIAAIGLGQTGRAVLSELMGLNHGGLPTALGLSPLVEESAEDMSVPEVTAWIDQALANRPDLHQLEATLASRREDVRATKGLYSPTVAVSGSWGYDKSSNVRFSVQDQSSAAGIELRWDLFTGGARPARVRIAESAMAEVAALVNRTKLSIQSEVRQAIIDLNDAQEQIRLQRETLETAQENRRIIQTAYVAGKEPLTRLNEAQRDYIEAEANLALVRIRLRQAWSDLRAAAGDN